MTYEFKNVKRILVIKLRHIGDVLLTIPTFRALREKFPNAYIAALLNSGTEEVLSGNSLIDEIIVFDRSIKKKNFIKKLLMELLFIRKIRKKGFDMTVDLTSGDRAAIISYISGARYRLAHDPGNMGFLGKRYFYTHLSTNDGNKHTVLQNIDVVKHFGIETDDLSVNLHIPEDANLFVRQVLSKNNIKSGETIIHVHPTSRWFFKCWKDEYMAKVISWLIKEKIRVIVTSSPDKRGIEKSKRILSLITYHDHHSSQRLINLCGNTNIKQLAAITDASDMFLGVDSAPMHIAAAVGTPVVALFGPSIIWRWAPWPNNQTLFQTREDINLHYKNGCYFLGDNVVIQRDWECVPCRQSGCNGTKQSKCLDDIGVEEVKGILHAMLTKEELNRHAYS